jgi:uncharacterized membrane-anchored protein YitT (DUF2179 family)
MIYYFLFCILLAYINYRVIKKGLRVYHSLNGLCHAVAFILFTLFVNIQTALAGLFMARVVFDVCLNKFRGLPIDYVPQKPKSIIDQLEKKVFKDGLTPKLVYVLVMAAILCI